MKRGEEWIDALRSLFIDYYSHFFFSEWNYKQRTVRRTTKDQNALQLYSNELFHMVPLMNKMRRIRWFAWGIKLNDDSKWNLDLQNIHKGIFDGQAIVVIKTSRNSNRSDWVSEFRFTKSEQIITEGFLCALIPQRWQLTILEFWTQRMITNQINKLSFRYQLSNWTE